VQATELLVRASSPLLHELLGVFLPLITTNCAVLGVALINLERQHGFVESLVFGAAAAAGFGLALLAFAGLRERMETTDVPAAFRGTPIALVTAGLMALAFMGFGGLGGR
jgi:electron transport complex protein RnfA